MCTDTCPQLCFSIACSSHAVRKGKIKTCASLGDTRCQGAPLCFTVCHGGSRILTPSFLRHESWKLLNFLSASCPPYRTGGIIPTWWDKCEAWRRWATKRAEHWDPSYSPASFPGSMEEAGSPVGRAPKKARVEGAFYLFERRSGRGWVQREV